MNKLTKFSRAILAIAIMLCVALPTFAHDFEVGGIYYNYLDNTAKTVEVTYRGSRSYDYSNEYTGSVTIPSSVTYYGTTYSVTSIGDEAFYGCTGLTSITIPNSVTRIGYYAFDGCSGLVEVTIPNSVTSISNVAFRNCSGLTSVTIGNSVTSIGESAFEYCSGLTSITIPNSVTSIGSWAFNGCSGLTKLILEDGAESISGLSFPSSPIETLYLGRNTSGTFVKGKTTLKEVTIGNSVTSIGSSAFYNCSGLTSITIPNSVTSIGAYAFYNCRGLTSITIPNSVTSIGAYAFSFCSGLTEVNISDLSAWCKIDFGSSSANPLYYAKKLKLNETEIKDLVIPNDITKIKDYAFYHCTGLTSITIPNSVTTIGNYVFYGCDGLTSVTIPNSVTSIGNYAFEGCDDLTEVNITDLSAWCKIDFGGYSANPLYYANKLKLNGSEITNLVIPNDITEIKDYAFSYCSGLTSVTIGNSVTSIGDYAFEVCTGLKTIVSLNPTPPTCASSKSFYPYSATLYVPKDSFAKYFIDEVWGQFTNIKKIEILVSSITLNNSSIELDKGNTATLSATIAPSNATIKNIVWTSSNPQIATVDQSGKVTALTPGTATITAKSIDGSNVSASCKVTVNSIIPTITLSQIEATLPVNEIMTLSYSITNSATKTATWSTSNKNVAYVKTNSDGSATIVGMADGVATITATMVDNGQEYSASCVVTVGVGGVEGVEMDNNAVEVARYDIHGRLLSEPTPGINIVKYSDGTTRKEIVKN